MDHRAITARLPASGGRAPAQTYELRSRSLPHVEVPSLAWQTVDGWQTTRLGAVTKLGRSLHADVRFDDNVISRRHAIIVCDQTGAWLSDDRSQAGTTLNGDPVRQRQPLTHGDVIGIGPYQLRYVEPTPVVQPRQQSDALSVPSR